MANTTCFQLCPPLWAASLTIELFQAHLHFLHQNPICKGSLKKTCPVTDFLFLCFYATVTAVQKLDKHWCDVTWISKLERRSSQKDLLLAGNLFHLHLWLATGMSNKPCVSRNSFYLCCPDIFLLWNISASIQTHLACTGCSYFTSSDWLLIFPHLASNQV